MIEEKGRYKIVLDGVKDRFRADHNPVVRNLDFGLIIQARSLAEAEGFAAEAMAEVGGRLGAWHVEVID